jgi:Xaa-Pro aminopeptidase
MNPVDGLRLENSASQLAAFEFAASHCSQAVRNLIESIQPGMSELDAAAEMGLNGLPLSAHLMLNTGPRSRYGLPSPTTRVIEEGDPFFAALGLRGGLTARAGFVAADEQGLPQESRGYVEHMVAPYFKAAVAWYEAIGIGVTGGEVKAAVDAAIGGVELTLNPGHYIHLDEWVHTPFYEGSEIPLRSGMLIQCDMIPQWHPHYHTANIEDTIALADEALRKEIHASYPGMWKRVLSRREFMQNALGISLSPEVLPFSNMAAALQPFVLNPSLAMTVNDAAGV